MKSSKYNVSRFIVGIILVIVAVLMILFTDYSTTGVIAIGLLGLISIATSKRKNN